MTFGSTRIHSSLGQKENVKLVYLYYISMCMFPVYVFGQQGVGSVDRWDSLVKDCGHVFTFVCVCVCVNTHGPRPQPIQGLTE